MIALDTLQPSDFTPLVGRLVHISATPPVDLTLREVKLLGHKRADAIRDPFSLVFAGPSGLRIPQGIRHVRCEPLGEMEIFIVQTGDGAKGSEFEAVFT